MFAGKEDNGCCLYITVQDGLMGKRKAREVTKAIQPVLPLRLHGQFWGPWPLTGITQRAGWEVSFINCTLLGSGRLSPNQVRISALLPLKKSHR